MTATLSGVFTPVVTPFTDDMQPDGDRLAAQCRWLLERDCGLAIFGTNSEGNSLSTSEKIDLIDFLIDQGINPQRMMPGTGACSLEDAIQLNSHIAKRGCGGGLCLPPFYYKGVSDDGVFAFFANMIEAVGSSDLKVYLYHIPPVAQVGFSLDLIERLIKAYPNTIVGIKDSSGDKDHTAAILKAFPGWGTFPGFEMHLIEMMELGAVGCISATANVNPALLADICKTWKEAGAPEKLERARLIRNTFGKYPMIPAMKATIADAFEDPTWANVRPPLLPLSVEQTEGLKVDLGQIDFSL